MRVIFSVPSRTAWIAAPRIEAEQAADHAAGAAVQVLLEPGQGAGLVAVQAEAVFQG